MPKLEEYRQKRDFAKTPEPGPKAGRAGSTLSYVIQKHAASHMHYDFRIELDGILLSWAVPKGPSLDPADKRLAMHVEDHPIAYGGFEGTIPKGEYGGGTVMLWDRGTWEPDHGDPKQHLAEGHLKFELHGERLKGRWMLVRTKGYGSSSGKESWLLFKERDEEVHPRSEFDALTEWTTSVATGRTMEQIASGESAIWHSDLSVEENVSAIAGAVPDAPATEVDPSDAEGAVKAKVPREFDVALATLVAEAPEGDEWLHEIKFDGYRIVALVDGKKIRLVSRNAKDWTDRFPTIAGAVSEIGASSAVLDGEVVVVRPDGTTDFQALQNFARSGVPAELTYMAFDLVYLDGFDLSGVPLERRKELLRALLASSSRSVRYSEHVIGKGSAFYDNACDMRLEGIVSKRRSDPYRTGRGRSWLKVKCTSRQEFVVVGWTDPGGSRRGFGALVIAVRDGAELRRVGRVGTGFTEASIREIGEKLDRLSTDTSPVTNPPTGASARGIHWVRPELVAEVAFAEWTSDQSLRHPSFLGLREDKPAQEVVKEKPVDEAKAGKPLVAGVLLSNPGRVLWPEAGLTKLDLAHYYETVAELMLPHVVGRPLSLVRCPSGYTGECFYQKHIEHFPKQVGTVPIYEPEKDDPEPYGTVRNLAGIIGLVQMGVLEIHPWGSKNDAPDKPDRLIFDLDPDAGLPYKQVAGTALLLRSELSKLGLESWLKSTGGKGLHVVVPITRRHGWDTAKEFSHAFVDFIVKMEPRLFTSSMSKSKRGGRIFIDYLRNARGATAIAPYSSRAGTGAPISVPLYWDELDGAAAPIVFTIQTIGERLSESHGDPWGGIGKKRQSITKEMLRKMRVI